MWVLTDFRALNLTLGPAIFIIHISEDFSKLIALELKLNNNESELKRSQLNYHLITQW